MFAVFDSWSGRWLRDFCFAMLVGQMVLVWPVAPAGAQSGALVPTIKPYQHSQAPVHAIGDAVGTRQYRGDYFLAGDYAIERDPYDPVKNQASTTLRVRRQSDLTLLATLDTDHGLHPGSGSELFSDGQVLAIIIRPGGMDDRANRVEVRALPDARLLYTLVLPRPQSGDDFGRAVWFTDDRILVAAPGRTRYRQGDGSICIFDRTDGRFIMAVSPGIRGARFGAPLATGNAETPYVQTYGRRALIVHGRHTFLFTDDRLRALVIPPGQGHTVAIRSANFAAGRIVLTTREYKYGRRRPGRVIVFDAAGRRAFQLHAGALSGSFDFPSAAVGGAGLLHVHDALARNLGEGSIGRLHTFDLVTGSKLSTRGFSLSDAGAQNDTSLAVSGGLLWLLHYPRDSSNQATTVWHGYDPLTLESRVQLRPPSREWFFPAPPQHLGERRFVASVSWSEQSLYSVIITIRPIITGGLVFDAETGACEARLQVVSSLIGSRGDYAGRLVFSPGTAGSGQVRVHIRSRVVQEWFDFITQLPVVNFDANLLGRIFHPLDQGFDYTLYRWSAAAYEPWQALGWGDGRGSATLIPYADYRAATPYLLQGSQHLRYVGQPAALPSVLAEAEVSGLAAGPGHLALTVDKLLSSGVRAKRVLVVDQATGEVRLTLSSPQASRQARFGSSPQINEHYVAVGSPNQEYAGEIDIFNRFTGGLVRTLKNGRGFGTSLALSGHRLATTWIESSYAAGLYTRNLRLTVYELPSGRVLYEHTLASETSGYQVSYLPMRLLSSGDYLIARAAGPSGGFEEDGRVRVFDFTTGVQLYELASSVPEEGGYFGAWLAAGGDWLAVGSPGAWLVRTYDLPSGGLAHTLTIESPAADRTNYALRAPNLSIDATYGYLSWFVSRDADAGNLGPAGAAYVFDLTSGDLAGKVVPEPASQPRPRLAGAFLADGGLYGISTENRLVLLPYAAAVGTPLLTRTQELVPGVAVQVRFPTVKGVVYQAGYSLDEGATWMNHGSSLLGDGADKEVVIPFEPVGVPEAVRVKVTPRWATELDNLTTLPGVDFFDRSAAVER